jgi:hypothetical protein
MIEKCAFGSMIVDGRRITSDLMIFPDGRIEDRWRRIAGHRLEKADIEPLLESHPGILVVGTGVYARMRLRPDLESYMQEQGIELVAKRNKTAVQAYNQLRQEGKKVAACFHLTC